MNSLIKQKQIGTVILDRSWSLTGDQCKFKLSKSDLVLNISTLSNIRILSDLDKIKSVSEYYYSMFSTLNFSGSIVYKEMLGRKKSLEYLEYLKSNIDSTNKMITSYHTDVFNIRKQCYKNLSKVELEGVELETPFYDHSGVTGRTSIKKGFNFLTLKKEKRSLIKPVNKNMCLVEVDFKSCEPFFYLKSIGLEISGNDVYTWLCNKYNISISNRDNIKRGILSMIYGANENTTARFMKVPVKKIKEIKNDLKLEELETNLRNEFDNNDFFLNYYGRPITSDNNVVNYYIQSSAVDFCSLAFDNFCKLNNLKPSYFIHDSMTFQCEKNKLDSIIKVKEIYEPYSKINIPVEFNVIYR
tara:strand:- start:7798 stop:8868 length:1071 start_codon:yes stop_codon:yes gene_type:complete